MKKTPTFHLRLFSCFFLLTIVLLLILMIPWWLYSRSQVLDQQTIQLEQTCRQAAQKIDNRLQTMDDSLLYVSVTAAGLVETGSSDVSSAISRLLLSLQVPQSMQFMRVNFYDTGGDYVYAGAPASVSLAEKWMSSAEFQSISESLRESPFRYLLPPHRDPKSSSEIQTVSILGSIINPLSYRDIGMIEIETRLDLFRKDLDGFTSDSTACALLAGDGSIYITTDGFPEISGSEEILTALDDMRRRGKTTQLTTLGEERVLLTSDTVDFSGWQIITARRESTLFQPYNTLLRFFLISIAAISLCAILSIYLVSRRMTDSIRALSKAVEGILPRELSFDPTPFCDSREIANLSRTFANLLENLRVSSASLVEQETRLIRANLMVLQSQMDPHFLYNMFSVIDSYAYSCEVPEICEICQRMGKMMRYVAAYDEQEVPLLAELQHAQDYLELMKFRYEDDFRYAIAADASCLADCMVPKHILQPLLENSFKHGFKRVAPPWTIEIRITAAHGDWQIDVYDNGAGLDEELRSEIFRKVAHLLSNSDDEVYRLRMDGLGLVNTFSRLRLKYGDDAKMEICCDEGCRIVMGGKYAL